jgi:hypothetical protein
MRSAGGGAVETATRGDQFRSALTTRDVIGQAKAPSWKATAWMRTRAFDLRPRSEASSTTLLPARVRVSGAVESGAQEEDSVVVGRQFHYSFGNTLSEEASDELFEKWTIPGPGRPLVEDGV